MAKKATSDPFNAGLAMYLEWGPSRTEDIHKRLAKANSKLTAKAIKAMVIEYSQINSSAHAIVIDQLERKQSEEAGRDAVSKIDSRISPENSATLYSQARISAWRDGYQ
jgi:hypothetical protein